MPPKVLIAHGDTQTLARAVRDLTVAGFEVVATPDGGDAFARFFEVEPDLVLCSEALPVLDGRSFGNMIQSQAPATPVVLLVAGDSPRDVDDFFTLPDPLDVAALRRLLADIAGDEHASGPRATPEPEPEVGAQPPSEAHALILRFQRQGNLLALLDPAGLERLASIAQVQDRESGERVIQEGEPCDGFYLVADGEVRVTIEERGDQEVARLGSGEFFGEMALLSEQPRSASVWTCTSTKLLFFEREAVLGLLDDYPELREVLGGVALQRAEENLWQALSDDDDVQRNLSELLEGVADEPGAQLAPAEPAATQGSDTVPRVMPSLDVASQPAVPAARGTPWWQVRIGVGWQAARLWSARHLFETGLVLGAVAGMSFIGVLMVAFGGDDEVPVAPVAPVAAGVPEQVEAIRLDTASGPAQDEPAGAAQPGAQAARPAEPDQATRPLPKGRKALRRALRAAYQRSDFAYVISIGLHLRETRDLDWESQFKLAQAQRRAGQMGDALQEYLAFAAAYPDNVYADDAQLWAAEICISQGDHTEATRLLKAVIANPKTNLKARAQSRLKTLK